MQSHQKNMISKSSSLSSPSAKSPYSQATDSPSSQTAIAPTPIFRPRNPKRCTLKSVPIPSPTPMQSEFPTKPAEGVKIEQSFEAFMQSRRTPPLPPSVAFSSSTPPATVEPSPTGGSRFFHLARLSHRESRKSRNSTSNSIAKK